MVTANRIRLTGLLRKKPWQRGFFYGPVRAVGPIQDSLEQSETEAAIGKAHLDLLTPSER